MMAVDVGGNCSLGGMYATHSYSHILTGAWIRPEWMGKRTENELLSLGMTKKHKLRCRVSLGLVYTSHIRQTHSHWCKE